MSTTTSKKPADKDVSPKLRSDAIGVDVDAAAFRRALSSIKANADLSPYGNIPVLQCVTLAMGDGNRLTVAHLGIDMMVSATVEAMGAGSVCVPLRTLHAFISAADGGEVLIRKAEADDRVTFTCGDFEAAIIGVHTGDAPTLSAPGHNQPGYRSVALAEGVMNWLISLTLPFVSTDETRYYLNGVCLEFNNGDDGMLRAVATDGHRLGTRQTTLAIGVESRAAVIVPRDAIKAVAALASGKEVTLTVDDTRAEFAFGDFLIRTKLIDGPFPDWRRVVPCGPFKEFDLDAGKLIRLDRATSGFKRFGRGALKLERTEGGMRATALTPDDGSVTANLRAEVPEDMEAFGMNSRYLTDMAKAFGSKTIHMGVTGPGDPMKLTSANGPAGEFAILMPMRV